ncbi:MAG: tetratricopeptide repeat protein, partial [bacterium]
LVLLAFLVGPAASAMSVLGSSNGRECYLHAMMGDGSSDAASVCRDALALDSLGRHDRAATLVNLGIVLTHSQEHAGAIDAFDKAEALRPGLTEVMINRGNTYFHLRDYSGAIAEYGRSLQLGTTRRAEAYVNRALAYEYIRDFASAARDYACALAHRPLFAKADRGVVRVRAHGHEIPGGCVAGLAVVTGTESRESE